MERRTFLKNSGLLAAGWGLASSFDIRSNKLPAWRGFNLLDFFVPDPSKGRPRTPEDHFRWIRDWGFDFIRIPIAYPYYLAIDHNKRITPEEVYKIDEARVNEIEKLVAMAHKYQLNTSLTLHRAPGYCINAGFHEPYNLWKDEEALKAFCFHWNFWAKRFKSMPPSKMSFDLVNEPAMRDDMNDQHTRVSTVPGDVYRKVAKAAAEAIRKENPSRLIIADGNNVGSSVIPEIIDLDIAQSCRGYNPGLISHYKAPWANKDTANMPLPEWPGKSGNRNMLKQYYQPWIDLVKQGVGVHCGECGCWSKTPHDVFLSWFTDVLEILGSNGIGFALWEFSGSFGVMNSQRSDVQYENWHGQQLDRKLLQLLQKKY